MTKAQQTPCWCRMNLKRCTKLVSGRVLNAGSNRATIASSRLPLSHRCDHFAHGIAAGNQPEAEGLPLRRLRAKTGEIGHLEFHTDSEPHPQASQAEGREFDSRLPLQPQHLMVEGATSAAAPPP